MVNNVGILFIEHKVFLVFLVVGVRRGYLVIT